MGPDVVIASSREKQQPLEMPHAKKISDHCAKQNLDPSQF